MDNKVKIGVIVAGAVAIFWYTSKNQKSAPVPVPTKPEPSYLVMGKRYLNHTPNYYVQYNLIGDGGEMIAQCDHPKSDGTGCEKYLTSKSYELAKDGSGRLLIDKLSPDISLRIVREGFWPENDDSTRDNSDASSEQ